MRLTAIGFTGYRAFRTPTRVELGQLSVIFGKNNSGKTTLTRAPLFVESSAPRLELYSLSNGNIRFGSSFSELASQDQAHPALSYWVQLANGVHWGVRLQRVISDLSETVHVSEVRYGDSDAPVELKFDLDAATTTAEIPEAFESARLSVSGSLDGILHVPSARPDVVSIYESRAPTELSVREAPYWLAKHRDLLEAVSSWFVEHLDGQRVSVDSWDIGFRLTTGPQSAPVNFSAAGRGSQALLPVVTLLKAIQLGLANPPIVIIEEPEAHLHPSAHGAIAELIATVSDSTQIITETHSENLILRLRRKVATGDLPAGNLRLVYVDEAASPLQIEVDRLGGVSNWPSGVFEYDLEEARAIVEARLAILEED